MLRLRAWEVAKLFKSGMVNVASACSRFPDSLKEVRREAQMSRYTGECPLSESLLVALANRTWRGKIPCAGNSVFALPEIDIDICILFSALHPSYNKGIFEVKGDFQWLFVEFYCTA